MGPRFARSACTILSCALFAPRAAAQHCQAPSETADELFHATLRAEAARFDDDSLSGYYEGLSLRAALARGIVRVSAGLPYYRLLEVDGVNDGFGDLDAKVELEVLGGDDWSLGPALFASFPTGSADERLGMGHVMIGPSAWVMLSASRAFLSAEVGYEQAIAGEDDAPESPHAHHSGAAPEPVAAHRGPIPNPMNPEELWFGANASYSVLPVLEPYLGATLALPTSEEGETRATLRAGASFPVGKLVSAVGFEIDPVGITRRQIVVTSVGFRY